MKPEVHQLWKVLVKYAQETDDCKSEQEFSSLTSNTMDKIMLWAYAHKDHVNAVGTEREKIGIVWGKGGFKP